MRVFAAILALSFAASGQQPAPTVVLHFMHGNCFDGTQFRPTDLWVEDGKFVSAPVNRQNVREIDLDGSFVVPPYGDAHEHNFDALYNTKQVGKEYLSDGIFYAQGMTDITSGAKQVVAAGLVDTPTTVDVTYAHGGITAPNGHPKEVYEAIANGIYTGLRPDQQPLVIASTKRLNDAYWQVASAEDLDRDWPQILAAKPDLIKIYLNDSEHFAPVTAADPRLGKGLDPKLAPLVVAKAHAAGLKVAAHVDTITDYQIALEAGVDEMGHLPGYAMRASDSPALYLLSNAQVEETARRHVKVQATAGLAYYPAIPLADLSARQAVQKDNLRRLKAAGVSVLIGSDNYGSDSRKEADYLHSLGVWTNLELLRMWSITTPETIFPKRRLCHLSPGYEANFLVLSGNPLQDWSSTHAIVDRWKQGVHIELPVPPARQGAK